jgi:hypothetical protein
MKNLAALAAVARLSAPALADDLLNFNDLPEGFLGTSFVYHGITFRDANDVGGSFPNGDTFTRQDIGNNFIIENSTYLFNDHPNFGSSPNTLTFGTAYIPGPNLSIGAFARATLDLPGLTSSAALSMTFYENGPWGGIVFHLDALRNGDIVDAATYTINNGGGRDRVANTSLSVFNPDGFDTLRLYATWGDGYSAPRLLVDDIALTPLTPPCIGDFNNDGFIDFMDYVDFVTCFETGSCPTANGADVNMDGFTDFFDYLDFVASFEAGC